jgi:hypothetical protein
MTSLLTSTVPCTLIHLHSSRLQFKENLTVLLKLQAREYGLYLLGSLILRRDTRHVIDDVTRASASLPTDN